MVNGGKSCWCFSTPIAREAIELVPAELRGLACICAKCGCLHVNHSKGNTLTSHATDRPALD
ncbi:MAG: cysteine-rich CWC family protein [Gemmatimonas sp.]